MFLSDALTDALIGLSDVADAAGSSGAKPEAPPVPPGLYNLRLDPDLKAICRRAGLRLSGRKNEVLARIVTAWQNESPRIRSAVGAILGTGTTGASSSGAGAATQRSV